jgi:hypothetical protein
MGAKGDKLEVAVLAEEKLIRITESPKLEKISGRLYVACTCRIQSTLYSSFQSFYILTVSHIPLPAYPANLW